MEIYNDTLCATHSELLNIWPEGTIKSKVSRGQAVKIRRACYGASALYAIDGFTSYKDRVEIYRRYPDLQKTARMKPFVEMVEPDGVAQHFYEEYTVPGTDGQHLTPEQQKEYSNNAAILNAFKRILDEAREMRARTTRKRIPNMGKKWEKYAEALDYIADSWPNTLPRNPRRLAEKYHQYCKGGYEVLISGKFLNTNTAKIRNEEQQSLMIRLISDPRNFDDVKIAKAYNIVAEEINKAKNLTGSEAWKSITPAAVAVWREKVDLIASASRLGTVKFRNKKTMQTKRKRPSAAMYMWTLDGWTAEIFYQKRNDNNVITYYNRLTVVVVLDPCNDYPVGYAIGTHENKALITEALRNAANHTAELFGHRMRAQQIQSDRYAISAMTPLYEIVGRMVTPAAAHNAKSKVIEPYFGYLNDTYFCLMPNWSGHGITSNIDKQPNSEYLNAIRHHLPDEEGCRRQIEAIIMIERQKKLENYLRFWDACPAERRLKLSQEQFLLAFGDQTDYRNTLEGSGLHVTLLGTKHQYDCFDQKFREFAHLRWAVRYDPSDLSHILAVSEDGTRRFLLEEKYVQHMALIEQTAEDRTELTRIRDFNEALEMHVVDKQRLVGATVEKLFSENPSLDNTLTRALLVDSRGQHKDNRSAIDSEGGNGPIQRLKTGKTKQIKAVDVAYSVEDEEAISAKKVYSPLLTQVVEENDNIFDEL